jgi:hypothetical protein
VRRDKAAHTLCGRSLLARIKRLRCPDLSRVGFCALAFPYAGRKNQKNIEQPAAPTLNTLPSSQLGRSRLCASAQDDPNWQKRKGRYDFEKPRLQASLPCGEIF